MNSVTAEDALRVSSAPRPRSAGLLIGPGLATLAMLAVLIGLGCWQLQRLAWKNALAARIEAAQDGQAAPLSADPLPFARVMAEGSLLQTVALYGAEVRTTQDGPQMGAQLIQPLRLEDGRIVLVDRGWVPISATGDVLQPDDDTVAVEAYMRPAEHATWLSAKDNPAAHRFYTLDPQAIGRAFGLAQVAPYTLVALGLERAGEYPQPAQSLPAPVNNHLQYALTWFGFAAILAVIFAIWAGKTWRLAGQASGQASGRARDMGQA